MTSGSPERFRPESETPARGYYGLPVIHRSHWKWLIIWYFFFGGIAGSAAVIGAFARVFGGTSGASLARLATLVSFGALAPCPLLLILDLGRPGRFLNMLRTIRPSSPMSLGSWGLIAFGLVSTATMFYEFALMSESRRGRPRRRFQTVAGRLLSCLNAATGFFLAGYTGVLLAATAVPLWSKHPGLLGPLFLSSAMTSGAAALTATVALVDVQNRHVEGLHRLEAQFTIAECVLLAAWIARLGGTARPITEGGVGAIVRHGIVGIGMVAPLALTAAARRLPHRQRRAITVATSVLSLVGVFALRYAVVEGGRRSADDPEATFETTG